MVRRNVIILIVCAVLVSLASFAIRTSGLRALENGVQVPGLGEVVGALNARGGAIGLDANSLLNSDWQNPIPGLYPTYTRVDNTTEGFLEGTTTGWNRPLIVDTKITDVKFCNVLDGKAVNTTMPAAGVTDPFDINFWLPNPDGIVDVIPQPLPKELNNIKWYEFNMLLSGISFTGCGDGNAYNYYYHTAYGPVDGDGNNHMYDTSGAHPRKGLGYLPVTVMYPQKDWNGRLIVNIHGVVTNVTGVRSQYLSPVDFQYLLKKGYAICTYQNGGKVPLEQNVNAHDDIVHERFDTAVHLSYYIRPGQSAPAIPSRFFIYPIKVINGTESSALSSIPAYANNQKIQISDDETVVRNIANLVKNLLALQLGRVPEKTYVIAASRGGGPMTGLNIGRGSALAVNYRRNGFTPRTGGNFIEPYNPDSGLVFDGFFGRAPMSWSWQLRPDNQFPMVAPAIFMHGTGDNPMLYLGSTAVILQKVQQSFADLGQPDNMNKWVRVYQPYMMNHNHVLHLEMAFNGGDMYYDPAGATTLERFNDEGRGWRLNDTTSRQVRNLKYFNSDFPTTLALFENILLAVAPAPLIAGHLHQCFFNLIDWVEKGIAPPVSRLDEYIMAYPDKPLPGLPERGFVPNPIPPPSTIANPIRIDSVEPVCSIFPQTPPCGQTKWSIQSLAPSSVQALLYIRDSLKPAGKFDYSTDVLDMPDTRIRTGLFAVGPYNFLVTYWPTINEFRPFTKAELQNGYYYQCDIDPVNNPGKKAAIDFKGYANHGDYVSQMTQYVHSLVSDRLYDPLFGAEVIVEAAHAPYPRPENPKPNEAVGAEGMFTDFSVGYEVTNE